MMEEEAVYAKGRGTWYSLYLLLDFAVNQELL